ncbi:hypothetical protein OG528_11715 [Streptomyces platensis]|uniref:hypothetical protein n=1 Tax=Streptomyces platensis TaxID=58346 RepID=UPI0030DF039D
MTPSPSSSGDSRRIPGNADEALEIARTQYAPVWPDGTPAPLRVHEFDIGYLVCAKPAPLPPGTAPDGRRRPMRSPGGTCVVVSKEDGAVCRVPHRPTADAIALYRKFYRPETL